MTTTLLIRVPEDLGRLYERILYPAGELQVRLLPGTVEALYRANKIQVLCRAAHLNLMELSLLSDAIHSLTRFTETELILPYLPYGRADRRFVEGDCHGLQTFGNIIDGLRFNRVRTLDAHSFRAAKNVANLVDITPAGLIGRAIADIGAGNDLAVLLPDEGARRYLLGGVLQCTKKRDPTTGKLSGFAVPTFTQSKALIVDDICDGGGTFIGLAKEINKPIWGPPKPAKELYLYVTHGVFSKGLKELAKYFKKIYTTNSIYSPHMYPAYTETWEKDDGGRVEVYSCEPALLD